MTTETDSQADDTAYDNRPCAEVRINGVRAAIWRNISKDGNPYYSVRLERVYKDADGQLQTTQSFNQPDKVLLASKVMNLAHSKVLAFLEQDYDQSRQDEAA